MADAWLISASGGGYREIYELDILRKLSAGRAVSGEDIARMDQLAKERDFEALGDMIDEVFNPPPLEIGN